MFSAPQRHGRIQGSLRKLPSSRKLRLVLLAVGLCCAALAGILSVVGLAAGNGRLLRIAWTLHAPLAAAALLLHLLLSIVKQRRKRAVRRRRAIRDAALRAQMSP